jgi:hypothetical protein
VQESWYINIHKYLLFLVTSVLFISYYSLSKLGLDADYVSTWYTADQWTHTVTVRHNPINKFLSICHKIIPDHGKHIVQSSKVTSIIRNFSEYLLLSGFQQSSKVSSIIRTFIEHLQKWIYTTKNQPHFIHCYQYTYKNGSTEEEYSYQNGQHHMVQLQQLFLKKCTWRSKECLAT